MTTIPQGKTIAADGGALVRVCPECGEQITLEQVVSDVYEVIDEPSGVPRTIYARKGEKPKGHHGESLETGRKLAPAPRGEHTDYDDAAYCRHYEKEHG